MQQTVDSIKDQSASLSMQKQKVIDLGFGIKDVDIRE